MPTTQTLILSCNTGEGHNSCAKAIKEYYDSIGAPCVIEDGLRFISPGASQFLSWGHAYVYRHLPWLFRFGYRYTEQHPCVFHETSPVHRFLTGGIDRLHRFVLDGGYTAIICTHVFTSLMVTAMLKKHPMELAACFVATDYTCSPSTKDSCLDYYFIPDPDIASDFESPAIPPEKLIPSGIPVRQAFYTSLDKAEAKRRFGIPPTRRHLLMMCGSMGCGPMKQLLKSLSAHTGDWDITVVCGNNSKLEAELKKHYASHSAVHILGYVSDMSALMDSADLCLTKPGGISVSEAAVKALPMVFIDAVAGCEEYNRIHFIRKGGARTADTVSDLTALCVTLLEDNARRQQLQHALAALPRCNAAKLIYETMNSTTEVSHADDHC